MALYELSYDRLMHFVAKSDPGEHVVVCIDMDDPIWAPLGDILMPGHDWDQYRRVGQKPIARGIAMRDGIESMCKAVIRLDGNLSDTNVNVLVFAAGGVSIWAH